MEEIRKERLKKISNVEKNFMFQCEICYQDFDKNKHVPMIVCPNSHALCLKCVNSNLFKQQYNQHKNPIGRFMCSKCSSIIVKQDIREHSILKEVCQYIKTIKEKDEEMKKQFYNYVGAMGMNLVSMRSDYDIIQKNNALLQKENDLLVNENIRLRERFQQIQKIKGSFQELSSASKKIQQMNETLELQKATLQSLKDEVQRKKDQIKQKTDEILAESQRFFQVKAEVNNVREDVRIQNRKLKELIQKNQGSIQLRQYLEQQIHCLKLEKKKIIQDNVEKKKKMGQNLKIMEQYWRSVLEETPTQQPAQKDVSKKQFGKVKIQQKKQRKNVQKNYSVYDFIRQAEHDAEQKQQKVEKRKKKGNEIKFDMNEKSFKTFYVQDQRVTLKNSMLSSYVHISLQEGFDFNKNQSFTIRIRKLKSQQFMIGLMTKACKNKKDIYNKKGFYGVDAFSKYWSDGNAEDSKISFKEGNQLKVELHPEQRQIAFSTNLSKFQQIKKLPQNFVPQILYPVFLLIEDKDSFEILQIK